MPSTASWTCSWRRCGSAATYPARLLGSPATRAASLVTTRWYDLVARWRIIRPAEPAAPPQGGITGPAGGRPRACSGAGNSPRRPMWWHPPYRHADPMNMRTGAERPPALPALTHPTAAAPPHRTPWLGVGIIAAAAFGIEMAVSGRYGYVRDELYFLSAGHHLAWGYVDQPALTPLLARLSAVLSGNTLIGLRVIPALGLAALVLLTAAMGRLLGAGRTGQVLAAIATATCGEYLGAMHELTTTTPDFVFWAVALYLVLRLLTSQDPRWWVAIGGCVGVASEAKWNIAFLAAALAAG